MRPLFHPAAEDITVEGILYALSDPVRVQIFVQIAKAECAQRCAAFLEISQQSVPKSTLSQHFKVLREAGLIRSERRGVEMHNSARCEEIGKRFGTLIPAIIAAHKAQTQQGQKARRSKRADKAA
jgi:DNA-binding transcriptional ArsR family regulator